MSSAEIQGYELLLPGMNVALFILKREQKWLETQTATYRYS